MSTQNASPQALTRGERKHRMEVAPALLEDWMRGYYFDSEIDIGSSGVENFSLAELRALVGLTLEELDEVVFDDSPSCGEQRLRQAVAARWGDGDPEKIMVTHGSSEVIFLIMNALLREGDEVVALQPCYHALRNLAESIGCELKNWPLRAERDFRPDVAEAISLIGPQTRMVIANFPHNPTGVTITEAELRELVAAAERVGAYLVWDAAFAELTYDGPPLPNPATFYERAIVLGTLSKGYGLAGLRVGWCVAPPELLAGFVHWRDYTTLYLSPLVERIALRAVERADELLRLRLERSRHNRDVVAAWIEGQAGAVEWVRPQGGVTAFVRLKGVADVESFCKRLAVEHGALLVPGVCFNSPEYARLGFGGPTEELIEGLTRLGNLLAAVTATTTTAAAGDAAPAAAPAAPGEVLTSHA